MAIFVLRDNEQEGPYQEAQIRAALKQGSLTVQTMAWIEGTAGWKPLSELFPEPITPEPVIAREVPPPKMSLAAILTDALTFPFRQSGWLTILIGAIFFAASAYCAIFFGMFFRGVRIGAVEIFMIGYLLAFYMETISASACGSDDRPDWPSYANYNDDIQRPLGQWVASLVMAFVPPMAMYLLAIKYESDALLVAAGVLALSSLFYYPMAILGAIVFGNFAGTLPHRVFPALFRTLPSSLLLGFASVILIILPIFTFYFSNHIPIIGYVYESAVLLYCLIAHARFLGLFYRRERDALQWG